MRWVERGGGTYCQDRRNAKIEQLKGEVKTRWSSATYRHLAVPELPARFFAGLLRAGYFLCFGFRMAAGFFTWTSKLGLQPVMLVGNRAQARWLTLSGLFVAGGGTT